ncbi:MAG: YybH family protein [Candidatus Acidiferrales bacterium]
MRKSHGAVITLFTLVCLVSTVKVAVAQSKMPTRSAMSSKVAIEALEQRYLKAFNAKDVNAIMANYAPGSQLFVFDAVPPREYPSWESYKKDWEALFAAFPGPVKDTMSALNITVVGPVAYTHHIEDTHFTRKDGTTKDVVIRVTDVFRKIGGKWLIVQEHVSFPVDIDSGKADLLSKP